MVERTCNWHTRLITARATQLHGEFATGISSPLTVRSSGTFVPRSHTTSVVVRRRGKRCLCELKSLST